MKIEMTSPKIPGTEDVFMVLEGRKEWLYVRGGFTRGEYEGLMIFTSNPDLPGFDVAYDSDYISIAPLDLHFKLSGYTLERVE